MAPFKRCRVRIVHGLTTLFARAYDHHGVNKRVDGHSGRLPASARTSGKGTRHGGKRLGHHLSSTTFVEAGDIKVKLKGAEGLCIEINFNFKVKDDEQTAAVKDPASIMVMRNNARYLHNRPPDNRFI